MHYEGEHDLIPRPAWGRASLKLIIEIYGITYVPYIYTYRESSSQLASVGLAALAQIILRGM